jgi:hypothetical protein
LLNMECCNDTSAPLELFEDRPWLPTLAES